MIPQPLGRAWLYKEHVDMRKSFSGLASLVQIYWNPEQSDAFVFFNKSRDKVKVLYWHLNGFCVFYKSLETETFKPPHHAKEIMDLTPNQVSFLLEGLDLRKIPTKRNSPSLFR